AEGDAPAIVFRIAPVTDRREGRRRSLVAPREHCRSYGGDYPLHGRLVRIKSQYHFGHGCPVLLHRGREAGERVQSSGSASREKEPLAMCVVRCWDNSTVNPESRTRFALAGVVLRSRILNRRCRY